MVVVESSTGNSSLKIVWDEISKRVLLSKVDVQSRCMMGTICTGRGQDSLAS